MARKKKKLGEILLGWGIVDDDAIAQALEYGMQNGKRIGEALIELELCEEEAVSKALANQFGLEFIDLDKKVIPREAFKLVPADVVRKHLVLPLGEEGDKLKIIITDPLDLDTFDLLKFRLNKDLIPSLAPEGKVKKFIDEMLSKMTDDLSQSMASIDRSIDRASIDLADEEATKAKSKKEEDGEAPIIRLLNHIIGEAVRARASDIHIEPMADRVRVRYRVDGVCHIRDDIPKNIQSAVMTRLKIISGMDIAEKRIPQDGRIKMKFAGNRIDFRVSCCPTYHGESTVLRILRPESASVGVAALGFDEDNYESFLRIIRRPNGIFLVTGPTGSGKTTTLYSALQELNRPDKKIITAEDPVEYNFAGMNQCQVRDDIGLTFALILRAMLRQAPNIILVGEIRDRDVGDVAIQAALTGHLVFSTLHTNDAPSAITRLIDMGIKPFLVASSIQAILAQRLIRTICKECRVEDTKPDKFKLKLLGFTDEELSGETISKGAGCNRCGGTGYHGRKGIFELLQLNNEIRELAFNRAPAGQLRKAALASGMRSLREDGKLKILRGITTPEEVLRVAQSETLVAADLEDEDAA
ncbi:MAG: type II/IV secretion system protein [Planctomycetes bacterium]|nr:type II/IV secretion system protein [Planctomycetota bacterium]